ncbi:50S ribosomal protein L35 [Candidatus Saccharibacteria bacterium]|nr:50S ribosomal protein L35 [Candidatus Saccharibacteria bacterium]
MPKLKTHSGTKKRVKITKTGKLVRRHARLNHFLQKKSGSRKRRLNRPGTFTGHNARNIKRRLGV